MKLLRKSTSLILLFSFVFVAFSSVGLDIAPHGQSMEGWTFLGVNMGGMKSLHSIFGYLMLVLVIVHTVINIKPIIAYIKENKNSWMPSKTAIFTTVFSAALLVASIISGNNHAEERKMKGYNISSQNQVTSYEITENHNRPSQY